MKVYLGVKKEKDQVRYGMTIYSETGDLLYSSTTREGASKLKFENALQSLMWLTKKVKTLAQNKTISEDENITLMLGNKTVYTWLEKETAPDNYIELFSELMLEMSFLTNQVEVIYTNTADRRVLYQNTVEDKGTKVTELFNFN